jgi:hypothetical protein
MFVAYIGRRLLARNRVAAARWLPTTDAEWLAGFVDAEGCFQIRPNNRGTTWTCALAVKVRDDDAALVVDLHRSTGLGCVRPVAAHAGSKPQVDWTIQSKDECAAFAALVRKHPLRGRKRLDAQIWSEAVATWAASPRGMSAADAARLTDLAGRLRQVRRYTGDRAPAPAQARANLEAYFGGFFAGDGYLGLTDSCALAIVKIRRDDRPLLELFAREFGLGLVRDVPATPPSAPTAAWRVVAARDLPALVELLDRAGLRGRKLRQYQAWRPAALEIGHARQEQRSRDSSLIAAARAQLQAASEYRSEASAIPFAIPADDGLEAYIVLLQEWAGQKTYQRLTCTAYEADRKPSWPNRDTLARAFGSWAAALAAADLR